MTDMPEKPAREIVEAALIFGRQLEKVIELTRYVESVDRLNQLADEANGRALLASQAEADANARRDAALAALEAASKLKTDEADKVLAAARRSAREAIDAADVRAKQVLAEAEGFVADTRSSADAIVAEATAKRAALKAEADALDGQIAAAKAELAGVQSQIDEARAVIAKLMGN